MYTRLYPPRKGEGEKQRLLSFITGSLIVLIAIPALAIGITEIVISSQHINPSQCNNDSIISPVNWLFTDASVMLFSMIITSFVIYQLLINRIFVTGLFLLGALITLFNLVWTIIGGIVLWRDNPDCEPQSLYVLFVIVMTFHLVAYVNLIGLLMCTPLYALLIFGELP